MERDDIPPIDVLEAAAKREREETEELLAGFDRPGRSPVRVRHADFVERFSPAPPPVAPKRVAPTPRAAKEATFVVPKRPLVPAWAPWALLVLGMIAFGGLVAYLATAEPPRRVATPAPTSVTTITLAQKPTPRADDVPPPAAPSASEEPEPPKPRPRDPAPSRDRDREREDFIRRF